MPIKRALSQLARLLTWSCQFQNDVNTAFRLEAVEPGSDYNGVDVILVDGGAIGDTRHRYMTVEQGRHQIDPAATTTNRALQASRRRAFPAGELSTTAMVLTMARRTGETPPAR
ncbi:MAG: hypothetical protein R3B96_23965 [Pirellulaceae bacterium]